MFTKTYYSCKKSFIVHPDVIKKFTSVIYEFCSKFECLSLAGLSSLVHYFWIWPRPYPRVEQLKGASLG
jgi:hypothetical protein